MIPTSEKSLKMVEKSNIFPEWIERNLESYLKVDGVQTIENAFWYTLTVSCPLIFESYAIVLHPFWINWKVKDLISSGFTIPENESDEKDFHRINWTEFFKMYDFDFNLKTANQIQEKIRLRILNNETKESAWPEYLWFPGDGKCETEDLEFIFLNLRKLYGDLNVNFYYGLLKTIDLKDKNFQGKISEFVELKNYKNLRGNPTAIFPDKPIWCIISDYDSPYTYIGGSKMFIDSITKNKEFDIHEITPTFPVVETHTGRKI